MSGLRILLVLFAAFILKAETQETSGRYGGNQYIVAIKQVDNHILRCLGFLVTPHHVLTTASCVFSFEPGDLAVYQEKVGTNSSDQVAKVTGIKTFPNFTWVPRQHDIALLELENSADMGDVFASISGKMPKEFDNLSTFGLNSTLNTTTYSTFPLLRQDHRVVSNRYCSSVLMTYIPCETICVLAEDLNYDTIYLGSPLIKKLEAHNNRIAINEMAYGIMMMPNINMSQVVTYVSLRNYKPWIRQEIGGTWPQASKADQIVTSNVNISIVINNNNINGHTSSKSPILNSAEPNPPESNTASTASAFSTKKETDFPPFFVFRTTTIAPVPLVPSTTNLPTSQAPETPTTVVSGSTNAPNFSQTVTSTTSASSSSTGSPNPVTPAPQYIPPVPPVNGSSIETPSDNVIETIPAVPPSKIQ